VIIDKNLKLRRGKVFQGEEPLAYIHVRPSVFAFAFTLDTSYLGYHQEAEAGSRDQINQNASICNRRIRRRDNDARNEYKSTVMLL
jgi:hypothetical protein